ncbi:MAG: 2-amino-4-hydroxy-6-hydroxymethyldihydropteridine diphosphokinase [Bacteroidales bacterium]|nr:2-amino-4-hydroxy-6-hydroxymethyldihydropteridine diphosphokinase [Bacteroidales bacterium]
MTAQPTTRAALLLGGNMGDTATLLAQARDRLEARGLKIEACSSLYETEPWGMESTQNFINQAVIVGSVLDAHTLLGHTQAVEASLGKTMAAPRFDSRGNRLYASRPIDIDIIFFGNEVVDEPTLHVPHPRMHLRRFVLEPLAEVAPQWRHPLLGQTVAELLANCPDSGTATRLEN